MNENNIGWNHHLQMCRYMSHEQPINTTHCFGTTICQTTIQQCKHDCYKNTDHHHHHHHPELRSRYKQYNAILGVYTQMLHKCFALHIAIFLAHKRHHNNDNL